MKETQKTWRDWLKVLAIALLVVAVFMTPAYIIHEQREETARVVTLIEEQAALRLEQMIQVNTFTISCVLIIPPEDRTNEKMEDCIQSGFDQAPDIAP